jgi:ADP-heptose:LPS heptosyltransferase
VSQKQVKKKILFVAPARVGDAVLASSILNHYLALWPNAEISVVTSPLVGPLFRYYPLLGELKLVSKSSNRWFRSHWLSILRWAVKTRWDLVVDMRSSALSYLLRTKARKIFRGVPHRHMVDQFADFVSAPTLLSPRIWYHQDDVDELCSALTRPGPYVILSPFSKFLSKDWPVEHYVRLLGMPQFDGYTVILTGVSSDLVTPIAQDLPTPDALRVLIDGIHRPVINLFDWGHLRHMVPLFEQCALFIGSDSGLMHMAAATRCPTIGLFGATDAARYGPWQNIVIQSPSRVIDELSVEMVYRKVCPLLPKLPIG